MVGKKRQYRLIDVNADGKDDAIWRDDRLIMIKYADNESAMPTNAKEPVYYTTRHIVNWATYDDALGTVSAGSHVLQIKMPQHVVRNVRVTAQAAQAVDIRFARHSDADAYRIDMYPRVDWGDAPSFFAGLVLHGKP